MPGRATTRLAGWQADRLAGWADSEVRVCGCPLTVVVCARHGTNPAHRDEDQAGGCPTVPGDAKPRGQFLAFHCRKPKWLAGRGAYGQGHANGRRAPHLCSVAGDGGRSGRALKGWQSGEVAEKNSRRGCWISTSGKARLRQRAGFAWRSRLGRGRPRHGGLPAVLCQAVPRSERPSRDGLAEAQRKGRQAEPLREPRQGAGPRLPPGHAAFRREGSAPPFPARWFSRARQ
jgi:hypothetical protein